jgi:hypothetical protein
VLVEGFVLLFGGALVAFVEVLGTVVMLVVLVLLLFGLGPVSIGFVVLVVVPLFVGIVSTATTVNDSDTVTPDAPSPQAYLCGVARTAERVRRDRE